MRSNTGWSKLILVPTHFILFLQIGGNMFLTAAHCLENYYGEVQEPSELTLFLGVHDKNNLKDAK